jgi:hypothetical protein
MEGGTKPERNPHGRKLLYRSGDMMMAVDIGSCYRVLVVQEAAMIRQILKVARSTWLSYLPLDSRLGPSAHFGLSRVSVCGQPN